MMILETVIDRFTVNVKSDDNERLHGEIRA